MCENCGIVMPAIPFISSDLYGVAVLTAGMPCLPYL